MSNKELNAHLRRTFKQLEIRVEEEEMLKKEIFNTLDTIELTTDLIDLFTFKFVAAETNFLFGERKSTGNIPPKGAEPQE